MKRFILYIWLIAAIILTVYSIASWKDLKLLKIFACHQEDSDMLSTIIDNYGINSIEDNLMIAAFGSGKLNEEIELLDNYPDNKYLLQRWISVNLDSLLDNKVYLAACNKLSQLEPDNGHYDITRSLGYLKSNQLDDAAVAIEAATKKPYHEIPYLVKNLAKKYDVFDNGIIWYSSENEALNSVWKLQHELSYNVINRDPVNYNQTLYLALQKYIDKWLINDNQPLEYTYLRLNNTVNRTLYLDDTLSDFERKTALAKWEKGIILENFFKDAHKTYSLNTSKVAAILICFRHAYYLLIASIVSAFIFLIYKIKFNSSFSPLRLTEYLSLIIASASFWLVYFFTYDFWEFCSGHTKENCHLDIIVFTSILALWLFAALSKKKQWKNFFSRFCTYLTQNRFIQPLLIMVFAACLSGLTAKLFDNRAQLFDFDLQTLIFFFVAVLFTAPACCIASGFERIGLLKSSLLPLPSKKLNTFYAARMMQLFIFIALMAWAALITLSSMWQTESRNHSEFNHNCSQYAWGNYHKIDDQHKFLYNKLILSAKTKGACFDIELLIFTKSEFEEIMPFITKPNHYLSEYVMTEYYSILRHYKDVFLEFDDDRQSLYKSSLISRVLAGDTDAKKQIDTMLAKLPVKSPPNLMRLGRPLSARPESSLNGEESGKPFLTYAEYYRFCIACYSMNSDQENTSRLDTISNGLDWTNGFCTAIHSMHMEWPNNIIDHIFDDIITSGIINSLSAESKDLFLHLDNLSSVKFNNWRLKNIIEMAKLDIINQRADDRLVSCGIYCPEYGPIYDRSSIPLLLELLNLGLQHPDDFYTINVHPTAQAIAALNNIGYQWPQDTVSSLLEAHSWHVRFSILPVANRDQLKMMLTDKEPNIRIAARCLLDKK